MGDCDRKVVISVSPEAEPSDFVVHFHFHRSSLTGLGGPLADMENQPANRSHSRC
jgi:hypothetical protein